MQKTIKIKLLPSQEQGEALSMTILKFNEVCNWLSVQAFLLKEFNRFCLQKAIYQECRKLNPGFSSQLVVRAIDVVCQAYKKDRLRERKFRRNSAVVYDQRVIRRKGNLVSLWTVDGRIDVPMSEWGLDEVGLTIRQSDLVCANGKWFLLVPVIKEDKPLLKVKGFLGVDLGEVNLAVTSDGELFSGGKVERKRKKYLKHRRSLQEKGTKSAKRRLKKVGKKESRFRRDVNHQISKRIVQRAKGTSRGIALEELKGVTRRTTVRKAQRARHMGWAFAQLRTFIEYKSQEEGVPVIKVSARNTSRMCSRCGHIDEGNRKSQAVFACLRCGFQMNADMNAAINISARAAVNQPIAERVLSSASPRL